MAVYTHVGEGDLARLLGDYALGALQSLAGVEQGVENTNYILTTSKGRFVLTLFEKRVDASDLPFFMAAMSHFTCRGVGAPAPIPDRRGELVKTVCGRPAVIVSFVEGRQRIASTAADCCSAGAFNARLHLAADGFSLRRRNALGLEGWRRLASECGRRADLCAQGLAALIADEIAFLSANWPKGLAGGLIHADLFPDNVFFKEAAISGVIDFYFACTDCFAYDLALTLNAWASAGGRLRADAAAALIAGYESVRTLSDAEKKSMPVLLRGAAMRILLTRLSDWLHQVDGALVAVKDPLDYRDLLLFHRGCDALDLFGKP